MRCSALVSLLALTAVEARPKALPAKPLALNTALKVRGGGAGELWDAYNTALEETPLMAKCGTSLTGFTIADIMTQTLIEKIPFDLKRVIRMGSFGALCHGSTGHYFYGFLDGVMPGTDPLTVATKVLIDQTLWAPIFMVMFFTYMGLFDMAPATIIPTIKKLIFVAVSSSWKCWIPAHTINFAFIPSNLRLFYINAVQIGFNCFLSIIGSKGVKED